MAHGDTTSLLQDFLALARIIRSARNGIRHDFQDDIKWKFTEKGCYSAASAYRAQFQGACMTTFKKLFWDTWAPGKIKIFTWLLNLNRLWCNDRLQRHGLENNYLCQFCLGNLECSVHLFWHCPFTKKIWENVSSWQGCQVANP